MSGKRVYVGGFQVFRKDAEEYYNNIRKILQTNNLTPLIPIDNECTNAVGIKKANCQMIRDCDAVIACITPFRGVDVEPGTAMEVGFAEALGKEVVLWSEDRRAYKTRVSADFYIDSCNVEDFNLVSNLMIQGNNSVWGSFEDAVKYLKGVS